MGETGEESTIKSTFKKLEGDAEGIGKMSQELDKYINTVRAFILPFSKVQSHFEELAKTVGLAGKGMMAMSERLVKQNRELGLSMSYGISNEEIISQQAGIMKNLSRNITFDIAGIGENNLDSELENIIASNRLIGADTTAAMVGMFDKIGISMKTAAKASGKLFAEASQYGINLGKFSENFVNNMEMVQTFTFSKGVDGLKEMARKATEIRQDMQQVASFANKVGSVTGAVETAANLQVLGGSFTALANPLAMLNESLTDMEGLQDRLISMTEGAARYNSTTRQIEMDPFTRMQMKRAAEVMGVDPKNLIDQAYAQARREEITRQMQGIGSLNEEFAKLLPNVGTIDTETGEAGVSIGNKFYTMSELAGMDPKEQAALQQQLVEETRSESDDVKAIVKSVMGIEDAIKGKTEQIRNNAAYNNIRKGGINGATVWDTVNEYIRKTLDNSVIKGASNIDHSYQSMTQVIETAARGYASSLFAAFDSSNFGDVNKKLGQLATKPLGNGPFAQKAGEMAESLLNGIKGILEPAHNYLKEHGYDVFSGLNDEGKIKGRSASPGKSTGSLNLSAPAVTTLSITPQTVNFDITPQGTGAQKIELIYPAGSFASSEGSTVRPPASTASSAEGTRAASETKVEHIHTFDGSIVLKVEGKGETISFTKDDIMKWLSDTQFREEFLHALEEKSK